MTKLRTALALCALPLLSFAVASCGGDSKRNTVGGTDAGAGGKGGSQQSDGGWTTSDAASSTDASVGGNGGGGLATGGGGGQTGTSLTAGSTALGGTTGTVQGGSVATGGGGTGGTAYGGTTTAGTSVLGGTTGTVQGGSTGAGGSLPTGGTPQGGRGGTDGSATGGAAGGNTTQAGSTATAGSATAGTTAQGGNTATAGSTAGGNTTQAGATATAGSATAGATTGGSTAQGGSTASTGGSGGSGGSGQALTGPDRTWTWIDFADAHCRDGSSTGLGLNLSSSSPNVMIFLDQGGACFNSLTCMGNAASYGAADFGSGFSGGIFDRNDTANPLRDYSFVFIPYCTGDVHAGNNPSGSVPGVTGTQQFVGYKNLDVFLRRLVPTFTRATQVLLTGSSAGGFGALMNAHHVARAFAGIPVTVLDDSGPGMPSTVVPTCLQWQWRTLWGLDQTVLADCGGDCPNADEYMLDLALHYAKAYPQAHAGLISSTQDSTIRFFFGFGSNDCANLNQVNATSYANGLTSFRASADAAGANIATYYISSPSSDATHHIWLMGSTYYAKTVGGTDLRSWVGSLLAGTAQHVGP